MSTPADISEIKTMLQGRVEQLCRELLPRGRREGGQWVSNNPLTGDWKKQPALKVGLVRDPGAWRCWRSGDKGDVLQLIAYLGGASGDMKFARRWAEDWLGIRAMSAADRHAARRSAEKAAAGQAQKAEKDRAKAIEAGKALFIEADDWKHDTPQKAHALAYFAARGVPLDAVPNIDTMTFRFSHSSEWWKGAKWETRQGANGPYKVKAAPGPDFPAVHSSLRTHCGQITGCHVTFLDPLRPAKAPVTPAKMMRGLALGSVISVSKGPKNKDPWIPQDPGMLVIAEGIETALTLAIALPEARVWAAGSLAGIGAAPVNMKCVGEIVVARDNNDGNDQAQGQLEAALEALEAQGRPLTVINSPVGDDFNDLVSA